MTAVQLRLEDYEEARAIGGVGILTREDLQRFLEAERRIYWLLKDGQWHVAQEIINHSGQREGLRRLRRLKARLAPYRLTVVKRRWKDSLREFEYRLIRI